MADLSKDKKIKLANTRKRFKELQELKRKKNDEPNDKTQTAQQVENSINCETPIDSLASSTHSSINNEHLRNNTTAENPIGNFFSSESVNFFDNLTPQNDLSTNTNSLFSNYFKNASSNENENIRNAQTNCDTHNIENNQEDETKHENYTLFPNDKNYVEEMQHITNPTQDNELGGGLEVKNNEVTGFHQFNNFLIGETEINRNDNTGSLHSKDVVCQDDPEIKPNQIAEYQTHDCFGSKKNSLQNSSTPEFGEGEFGIIGNVDSSRNSQDNTEYTHNIGTMELLNSMNVLQATDSMAIRQEIDNVSQEARNEVQHSSVESLRQLSDQMAQMIEPSYEFSSTGGITDLEKRNLELAGSLEREKITSEQLRAANQEYLNRISQLEAALAEKEVNSNIQSTHEISRLKQELQTHIQTIGLLVAEKTELAANINQYELMSKQKSSECEELQARLKASRSRVAEYEKEINALRSEKMRYEAVEQDYNGSVAKIKSDYDILKEQKEELVQDLLEAREKLKNSSGEILKLQEANKEITNKLSLAELKIQQLTSGTGTHTEGQVEKLTQEKFELEKQLHNLNQMLKTIVKERDESSMQYQQYAQQLNNQIVNLSDRIEQMQHERESLLMQEQNRIKHIGELERQLQNLQNEHVSFAIKNTDADVKLELDNCRELCVQLQVEKTTIEENYTKICNEKDLLVKELDAKNDSISQMESLIEQLRGNQPDSVKLLATMESDKVAAARAVQQNKELKQQMESMQEVFMKLNNDKVDLTEKFIAEQRTNKELIEKLQKTELHLQTLADAIEIKDRELTNLRENSDDFNKHVLQHEQLADRLRHYEAQENSSHVVENELQEAKQIIIRLTNEVNKLRNGEETENATEHTSNIADVENIVSKVEGKLEDLEITPNKLQDDILDNNENTTSVKENTCTETENPYVNDSNQNIVDKDHALIYLEEKVKRTMAEIADLTEEKHRLEHIVLQLQGETETIGEYVALYQHQRMVLKQKALEKDQQLKQLANDREQMKENLDKLNGLIKKLVLEKGAVPKELIEHQLKMNNQSGNFCEEHSRMNDDISSMTAANGETKAPDSETAEKIISLLSEIKTSNLVQPQENFHNCPWCSGQLTVV